MTPDTFLRRADAVPVLNEAGFPIAHSTLSTYASRGLGPDFVKFGRAVLYPKDALLEWARGRVVPRLPTERTEQ